MADADSSSDYDGPAQAQALPVNPDLEIDESRPASTAEEYLLRVRRERRKLPKIFHAKIDPDKLKQSPSRNGRQNNKCFNPYAHYFQPDASSKDMDPSLLPNKQWRETFVAEFTAKRQIVIDQIATMENWSKSNKRQNLRNSPYSEYQHLVIPKYQHRSQWLQFALNLSATEQSDQFGCIQCILSFTPCTKLKHLMILESMNLNKGKIQRPKSMDTVLMMME